jgi:hemolysin III
MVFVNDEHGPHLLPSLRGWLHLVSFPVMLLLGGLLTVLVDLPVSPRMSLVVYVLGTATMFGVSALYHRVRWRPRAKRLMQRVDHSAIFLAIAGGYTPVTILCLNGRAQWVVLVGVWSGALLGIVLHWLPRVPTFWHGASYMIVSWAFAVTVPAMWRGLGPLGFGLILGGGVCYTVGAISLAARWPNPWPRVFGFHEVFHAFTVIAAGLQFAAIAGVVAPRLAT